MTPLIDPLLSAKDILAENERGSRREVWRPVDRTAPNVLVYPAGRAISRGFARAIHVTDGDGVDEVLESGGGRSEP